MKRTVAWMALLSAFALRAEEPIRFQESLDVVEQDGYRFQRLVRLPQGEWVVEVTRGGKVVHRIFSGRSFHIPVSEGYAVHPALRFARHSLMRGSTQVVIRLWTGGGKCCNHHWVLRTQPSLGVLLETKRFDFDDLAEVVDLDGDGFDELGFSTTTFDYFGVCFACSPKPVAWFRYNAAAQRYEPANDTLFPYLKARYEKSLRGLRTLEQYLADHISDSYMRGDVMGIVLNYLYAGRDAEAWAIHKKRYTFEDQAENRVHMEQRLASDAFYQELRARRKRDGR